MLAPPKSLAEQPPGIQRRVVHGVPTFTGTGAFAPAQAQQAPAAVARPTLVNPTIAPVQTPGVVNQSETTDQRRAREAALSEIGTQLFLARGRNTRGANALAGDLLRTQADVTNTAGNQAVQLKTGNLDAQTRMGIVGVQNQGENDRTVAAITGENQRAGLLDAGETDRERIKLERPSLITDRDGGYLLVNPMQGVARPVLSDGQQVRGLIEGAITPADRLASLQDEYAALQGSFPNPTRIGELERQIDALRRPNTVPLPGEVVKGFRFRGGDPNVQANWVRVEVTP